MGVSSMKKLLSGVVYAILFVAGGFVVLWIFDTLDMNLSLDESGFLLKLIDLNWFHGFSEPALNGFFTLIVMIGLLMIVFRLLKMVSPKR